MGDKFGTVRLGDDSEIRIDPVDHSLLAEHRWRVQVLDAPRVVARERIGDRWETLHLPRLITGAAPGQKVSFRNRDTLDLRRENLVCGKHPGSKGSGRPCPFSAEELREMHHEQMIGRAEIARLASEKKGWAPPATPKVAERWLREAGIPLRTKQDHNAKLGAAGVSARNAERAREELAQMREAGFVTMPNPSHLHTPRVQAYRLLRMREVRGVLTKQEGRRLAAMKRWRRADFRAQVWAARNKTFQERGQSRRDYFCPECGEHFREYASRRTRAQAFCSSSCRMRFEMRDWREEHSRNLFCANCGRSYLYTPNRTIKKRLPLFFCSRTCEREYHQREKAIHGFLATASQIVERANKKGIR